MIRGSWRVTLLAIVLMAVGSPALAGSRPEFVTGAEWQDDVMVSWIDVEVDATPEQAFEVLVDYGRLAEFLPGVLMSRVVDRDGPTVRIEQELEESVLMFRQRLKVRMAITETPPRQLTLKSLEGSFRSYDGQYQLMPLPDAPAGPRTRIMYRARFVPDFDLPRMMGPFVVKRSLEKNHRALVREIQRRAAPAAAK